MPSTRSKSAKGKKKAPAPAPVPAPARSVPPKSAPAEPDLNAENQRKYREEISTIVHHTPFNDGLGEETTTTTVATRTFFDSDGAPYLVTTTTRLVKQVIVEIAHADGLESPTDNP